MGVSFLSLFTGYPPAEKGDPQLLQDHKIVENLYKKFIKHGKMSIVL